MEGEDSDMRNCLCSYFTFDVLKKNPKNHLALFLYLFSFSIFTYFVLMPESYSLILYPVFWLLLLTDYII